MNNWGKKLILCSICSLLVGCGQKDNVYDRSAQKVQSTAHDEQAIGTGHSKPSIDKVIQEDVVAIPCYNFMNERLWLKSIEKNLAQPLSKEIVAGIIPHHDVARDYITSFYQTVKATNKEDPDLVLLIGPNHEGIGSRFQLGAYQFLTREGAVMADIDGINQLIDGYYLTEGIEKVYQSEHAIGIHMPYIKHYFPEALVIPCIIGETHNMDGIMEVADRLQKYLKDKHVLIIASIDFSHYLTLEEANEKDAYTRELIEASDYYSMISLDSDYIDSPSSYGLLITLLSKLLGEDYSCQIMAHDNVANIWGNLDMEETTSYFQVAYTR